MKNLDCIDNWHWICTVRHHVTHHVTKHAKWKALKLDQALFSISFL